MKQESREFGKNKWGQGEKEREGKSIHFIRSSCVKGNVWPSVHQNSLNQLLAQMLNKDLRE